MRWLLPAVLMLTACEDRRSFDDRYADTEAQLENKARALDEQAANRAAISPENVQTGL